MVSGSPFFACIQRAQQARTASQSPPQYQNNFQSDKKGDLDLNRLNNPEETIYIVPSILKCSS